MNSPACTISVIVPIYKVERFLPACVESLLAQSFYGFELILVDDGSPDGCAALCDAYAARDGRVRVIHRKNGGLSAARNSGIEAARGEFLAFVDADDIVAPDYLEQLYHALRSTGADMALCAVEDVNEDGSPLDQPDITRPTAAGVFPGRALLAEFFGKNSTCYTVAWNKLYRRSLWQSLRYPEGLIHEDDAVAHRLYAACEQVVCLDAPLYFYRLRQGSICRNGITPGSFDGVSAHADWCRFFRDEGFDRTILDKALAGCFRRYLALCAGAQDNLTWPVAARWHGVQAELRCLLPLLKQCKALTLPEKLSCLRWCTRPLPLPPKSEAKRVALLLPPGLPVPAVKGGAVEGLATHLMAENQKNKELELALVCVQNEQAAAASARFSQSLIHFVPPAGTARTLLHRIRFRLARLARRPVYWQEYQHHALGFLKRLDAELYSVEGGQLDAWQEASARLGPQRMAAHLHGIAESTPALDCQFGLVLAISDYVRQLWLNTSTHAAEQVRLLHNCIAPEFLAPARPLEAGQLRRETGLSEEDFLVLFCGRIEPQKGVGELMAAMEQLPDSRIKLAIVGQSEHGESDAFEAELRRRADKLNGRVRFAGRVAAEVLPLYYQAAQVCVVPTLIEEAAGLVAVEAMASGCPLIVTQSGGLPEYVAGSGAVVLPRGDGLSTRIAQAITALQSDPERRAEMSAAGRDRAKDFTTGHYYRDFCRIVTREHS